MPITFPLNPADGQLYTMGGIVYIYKLVDDKWVAKSSITGGGSGTPPVDDIYFGLLSFDPATGDLIAARNDGFAVTESLDGRYLELAGGTMTGTLTLAADPVLPLEAVTKQYVDSVLSDEIYTTAAIMDATTGFLTQTRTNGTTYSVDLFAGMDARYVNAAGDTITGSLTVLGSTTVNTFIANGPATFNDDATFEQNITSNTLTVVNEATFQGDVYTEQNLYSNNVTVAGDSVFNGDVYTNQTLYSNTVNVSGPATFSSNVTIEQTLVSNNIAVSGNAVFSGPTVFNSNVVFLGTLSANSVSIALGDLTDANTTGASVNQILQYNGVEWVAASLPPATTDTKLNGMSFDTTTRVLTATVSDGNIFSATIPAEIDDFVNAVAFDSTTRVLTISRTDGQVFSSVIPDSDQFVNIVSFNDATNTLTINRNDGQVFTTVIPDEDKYVSSAAFNTGTRTLTLTRNDGGTVSVIIPDSDVFLSNSTFDVATRTLTLTRNDGTLFTHVIPDTNTFTTGLNFDTNTRVLTLTRNDGVSLTTTIPQTSVASLIDNVTYNDASRTLSVTKADGTATAYLISDADTKLSSLAFDNLTRVLTATLSDGTTKTATIGESADKLTTLSLNTNILSYKDELGNTTNIDLSLYLDDTNLARIVSGTVDATTGIATFMRDDATNFTVDMSGLKVENLTALSYDSANNILTYKDENGANTNIQLMGGGASVTVAAVAPTTPADGDLWYDTNNVRTFVWLADSNVWVDAAPAAGSAETLTTLSFNGTTGNLTYKDELAANTVIKLIPDGTGAWQAPMWTNANGWVAEPIVASRLAASGSDAGYEAIYSGSIVGSSGIAIAAGHTYYNTTNKEIRVYDGTAWKAIGGSVDTVDAPFVDNVSSGTISLATGNRSFKITMTGPLTITLPTGLATNKEFAIVLHIIGNGSAITWPASVKWNGGVKPDDPTSGQDAMYVLSTINGGTNWYASQNGLFS